MSAALEQARDALHALCLERGSTDGYGQVFDAINAELAKRPQVDRLTVIERNPTWIVCRECLAAWPPNDVSVDNVHYDDDFKRCDGEIIALVPATDHQRAVEAEREWCRQIIDADQRDGGDGRIWATLANMAGVRLREIGGQ